MEQGDVGGRDFLPRHDDPGLDGGHLAVAVVRTAHLGSSDPVIEPFEELNHFGIQVIFIFVKMHECIADVGHIIVKSNGCGVLQVRGFIVRDKESHEGCTEFGLARTLRPEQIENGKRACRARDDVAEERGQPIA